MSFTISFCELTRTLRVAAHTRYSTNAENLVPERLRPDMCVRVRFLQGRADYFCTI